MKRLALIFVAFYCSAVVASDPVDSTPEQEHPVKTPLPVYGVAEPFTPEFHAVTQRGPVTATIDVEKTLAAYPESMRPWKPDELENARIFLPLGEGESIDDKVYRFTLAWNEESDEPLRIADLNFLDYSYLRTNEPDPAMWQETFRYRPVELFKGAVVRCKFHFRPVKFQPPDLTDVDFRNVKDKTAPRPELLAPLPLLTAQMKVLVNGKNEGFNVHFSRDGKKWYGMWGGGTRPRMPYELLPYDTLFVRIATEDGEPVKSLSLDFEAILETRGFRGTGATLLGHIRKHAGNIQRDVDFPAAFVDGAGDLHLWIDNPESEPFGVGGWLAHNFSGRERFGVMLGGYFSDGFFSGPTVPANSAGMYSFTTSKTEPGSHRYIFHFKGISFHYHASCEEIDKTAPNPGPGFLASLAREPESRSRGKDYAPENGKFFLTFDDELPDSATDAPGKP